MIADIGRGRWAGRSLAEIQESDGEGLTAWFGNPAAATPEGETMDQVVARIAPWMEQMSAADAAIVAVTHAAVIRATIAHALQIPVTATLNIDIAPLSKVILSFNRLWRLQALES